MPPLPGEERLLTLFADVHYYFEQPSNRPLKHRFDKASYFYLYYNATRQTSRIEIANCPGTSNQDAVHGYIDKSRVTNSRKFPTRISIEIEADGMTSSPTSPVTKDLDEWRLFGGDVQNDGRAKLKVHTIDLYLWAENDARLTIDFLKKLLDPAQLDVEDGPRPAGTRSSGQQDNVSPVVKNLENIAVSDPAYQNGRTRNSQDQAQAIPVKLPPPPPPPTSIGQAQPSASSPASGTTSSPTTSTKEPKFVPMAYNPAAPAAPEPIAHREKTPPPPDDASASQGLQHPAREQSYGSPQHSGYQSHYSQFSSPPPPPPLSTTPGQTSLSSSLSHISPPPSQSYPARTSTTSTALSFAPPPTDQTLVSSNSARHHSTAAETYAPQQPSDAHVEAETPNEQFYNSLPQERKPLQHVQPRYQTEYFTPTGSAAYPQHSQSPPQNEYDIHSSVYRPTEVEAAAHHHGPPKYSHNKQDAGSLKGFANRFTTRVNKTIQKAESKYL